MSSSGAGEQTCDPTCSTGRAPRGQADPPAPQPCRSLCPCAELATPARETHLRVLRLRSQREFPLPAQPRPASLLPVPTPPRPGLGPQCCSVLLRPFSPWGQEAPSWRGRGESSDYGPKLVGSPLPDNVGLPKLGHCSLPQYLGSMLIKDLRGTESTQDACAKMRVGYLCGVKHGVGVG